MFSNFQRCKQMRWELAAKYKALEQCEQNMVPPTLKDRSTQEEFVPSEGLFLPIRTTQLPFR